MDLDGAYVKIIAGTGEGQVRRIVGNDVTQVRIDQAWDVEPVGGTYEIGGIPAKLKLKFSNLGLPTAMKHLKFMEVDMRVVRQSSSPKVRVYSELDEVDYYRDVKEVENPTFFTGGRGRALVGLQDASGYTLGIEIDASGPDAPLSLKHLAVVSEIGSGD